MEATRPAALPQPHGDDTLPGQDCSPLGDRQYTDPNLRVGPATAVCRFLVPSKSALLPLARSRFRRRSRSRPPRSVSPAGARRPRPCGRSRAFLGDVDIRRFAASESRPTRARSEWIGRASRRRRGFARHEAIPRSIRQGFPRTSPSYPTPSGPGATALRPSTPRAGAAFCQGFPARRARGRPTASANGASSPRRTRETPWKRSDKTVPGRS
jgi:hypothetical protein